MAFNIPKKQLIGDGENEHADSKLIRFVTFNVNGIRTLFQYQPFSHMYESLRQVFDYFDTDVITFQELKIERSAVQKWGQVDGFYSFISLPVSKKGYSGVGCWIRKYPADHPLHHFMKVVKAEEGITGYLKIKLDKQQTIRYRDNPNVNIGGYHDILSEEDALTIDSQGRCVIVELGCNLVIFSAYCPANSTKSEEGEIFRMKFLKVLFGRIRNLEGMGKKVVLMGDLNVCRDLIDSAELLDQSNIKITNGINDISNIYFPLCKNFILNPETPHRRIFNQLLTDSLIPECSKDGVLIDSTRFIQGRSRLKMYTVWNTLKNTRPSNFGSRIDFILVSDKWKNKIQNSNILPEVMGSDHCPVFTDMAFTVQEIDSIPTGDIKIPKFEASFKYNLLNHNILTMFSVTSNKKRSILCSSSPSASSSTTDTANNSDYAPKLPANNLSKRIKSNSRSNTIDSFFTRAKSVGNEKKGPVKDICLNRSKTTSDSAISESITTSNNKKQKWTFRDVFGEPPLCKHGEEAVLKTSRSSNNPGKRFWTCNRPRGSVNDKESSCGFFQWVQ